MKVRYGFVSNSSSTSFYVAFNEKPTEEEIFTEMGVAEESPFAQLAKRLAKYYYTQLDHLECNKNSTDAWDIKNYKVNAEMFISTGLEYKGYFTAERDWCEDDQPLAGLEMPPIKNEKIYIVNAERGDM